MQAPPVGQARRAKPHRQIQVAAQVEIEVGERRAGRHDNWYSYVGALRRPLRGQDHATAAAMLTARSLEVFVKYSTRRQACHNVVSLIRRSAELERGFGRITVVPAFLKSRTTCKWSINSKLQRK